jgi:hypothetical protein
MIRCTQPASYERCADAHIDVNRCSLTWHTIVTPLCPLKINGTQADAARYALLLLDNARWRVGSSGINNNERQQLEHLILQETPHAP